MKKYKTLGFTLAEVLITLVIIGVIAAMTVPAIIQQTQKQEYVSGLKKAQSTLANALYRIAGNNGYPHGDYIFLKDVNFIDEFAKVANIVKKCNTMADCFGGVGGNANAKYKLLNGVSDSGFTSGKSVITNDGQMYSYAAISAGGTHGISEEDKANLVGRIVVDLNGWKTPNKVGYDVFMFYIIDGKGIIPAGAYDSDSECKKNTSGYTCTAKVLKENKISY